MACEVVKNQANHQEFHYCRTHKVECDSSGCPSAGDDSMYPIQLYSQMIAADTFSVPHMTPITGPKFKPGDKVRRIARSSDPKLFGYMGIVYTVDSCDLREMSLKEIPAGWPDPVAFELVKP